MQIAVTSKSLSQSPIHRQELIRRYPGVTIRFNDSGGVLRGQDLIAFLKALTDNSMATDERFSNPF